MPVDPRHLKEATRRAELLRGEHHAKHVSWEQKCRARVPELAGLDAGIAQAVTRAITAALRHGVDPRPEVEKARADSLALQEKRREVLTAAGIDPATLEDTPWCPLCNDTGRYSGGLCRCVKDLCIEENRKELSRQLDLSALKFEDFSLKWYSPEPDRDQGLSPRGCMQLVFEVCRDYAGCFPDHPLEDLLLYGGTGLGKTFLSGCIANEVSRRGYWTVYETAGALFRRYESAKFQNDADALEDVKRYENCDLLVIDDLGSEMTTDFVRSALYQVVNQRLLGRKHTVISSNLNVDDIRGRYSSQVASRIEGEYRALPFLGEDIRLQKKAR